MVLAGVYCKQSCCHCSYHKNRNDYMFALRQEVKYVCVCVFSVCVA